MKLMSPDVSTERRLAVQHALLNSDVVQPGHPSIDEVLVVDGLLTPEQQSEYGQFIRSYQAWCAFALDPAALVSCFRACPVTLVTSVETVPHFSQFPSWSGFIDTSPCIKRSDRMLLLSYDLPSTQNYIIGTALTMFNGIRESLYRKEELSAVSALLQQGWLVKKISMDGTSLNTELAAITLWPKLIEVYIE